MRILKYFAIWLSGLFAICLAFTIIADCCGVDNFYRQPGAKINQFLGACVGWFVTELIDRLNKKPTP